MNTPILELAGKARESGLAVQLAQPLVGLPDVHNLLGVPMDPQLAALYRATNGFGLREFYVLPILGGRDWDLDDRNASARETLDYIPLLHDVLMWARDNTYLTDVTSIPALADEQGRQPVVLLDAVEAPFITPLASTLNRALELIVEDRILAARDGEMREVFPTVMAEAVAQDTRLMQLIDAGAFHDLGGGVDLDEEWLERLRAARGER